MIFLACSTRLWMSQLLNPEFLGVGFAGVGSPSEAIRTVSAAHATCDHGCDVDC